MSLQLYSPLVLKSKFACRSWLMWGMLKEPMYQDGIRYSKTGISTLAMGLVQHVARFSHSAVVAQLQLEEGLHSRPHLLHPGLVKFVLQHLHQDLPAALTTEGLGRNVLEVVGSSAIQCRMQPQPDLLVIDDHSSQLHVTVHLSHILLEALRVCLHISGENGCRWQVTSWPLAITRLRVTGVLLVLVGPLISGSGRWI